MGLYSKEKIEKYLSDDGTTLVHCFEKLDSTSSEARRMAREGDAADILADGKRILIVSNEQSEGRGRMGRSFYSPPDTGVYMSLLYSPDGGASDALKITSAAAVAVCLALERICSVRAEIKWVNDIFINEKKVCGILAESTLASNGIICVTVGIGINLSTVVFPEDIQNTAGAVGKTCERERLVAEICRLLFEYAKDLSQPYIMQEYRSRFALLDREVVLTAPSGAEGTCAELARGKAVGVDGDGALLLKMSNGDILRINSGEVSLHL